LFIAIISLDCYGIGLGGRQTMKTQLIDSAPFIPSETEAALANESSRLLAACIGKGPTATLRVINGNEEITVPVAALKMLVDILANMAEGNAISIVPTHAELTTQEAADFIGVSRPYLVGLLQKGELKHHKVGTHRRVYFRDLLEFREKRKASSEAALNELAKQAQELGMGY
jgi:excisionase family DNA binding protein